MRSKSKFPELPPHLSHLHIQFSQVKLGDLLLVGGDIGWRYVTDEDVKAKKYGLVAVEREKVEDKDTKVKRNKALRKQSKD